MDKKARIKLIKDIREEKGIGLKEAEYMADEYIKNGIYSIEKTPKTNSNFYDKVKSLPGFDSFGTKKEIKYLATMLYPNEEVFAIASGIMDNNTWLITCTSKRIIFIDCGMIYGVKHSEIMIDKVNAVSFTNGLLLGDIHIEDGASRRTITNVSKNSTKPFVDAVHKSIELNKVANQEQHYSAVSRADELLKFKNLLDMGVITQEEFQKQKEKILEL